MVSTERSEELKHQSRDWPSVVLSPTQLCDLELLLNGAYAAPGPMQFNFEGDFAPGASLALRDPEGLMLAALHIQNVHGDGGVSQVSGRVEGIRLPLHSDFTDLRFTPAGLRAAFERDGWGRVVAFDAERPLLRSDFETLTGVARERNAKLLLAAPSQPAGLDLYTLIRCHRAVLPLFPNDTARLAVLPRVSEEILRHYGCSQVVPSGALFNSRAIQDSLYFPEVAAELRHAFPPRSRQGFTVFFTGLSGSGKSTIANVLRVKLLERGRQVTLLDGDLVRQHLSSELGFSPEHRDMNIRRIGYVGSEITRYGGVAICAPIAPYDRIRRQVREMIQPYGGFILVHVATPIEVCEGRDVKGLYAKARAGLVKNFTGISDPYEIPEDAELRLDTAGLSPEQSAAKVLDFLETEGYLAKPRAITR